MSAYKRFVSYLYEYDNRKKGKNRGFVRVEVRNHQCCLEHDINPGTFYNWVHRFRIQVCEFPAPAGKDRFQAVHQEVVKMEIIPDHP